jgi:hypothetical protein
MSWSTQRDPRRWATGPEGHGSEVAPPSAALLGMLVAVLGSLAVWTLLAALVYGMLA